jgi:hypothetical protein
MWSLNLQELRQDKEMLSVLYQFYSPIHRAAGGKTLSNFQWLTTDRSVQRTRFLDDIELTANFGEKSFQSIPPACIQARWEKEQRTQIFCPEP